MKIQFTHGDRMAARFVLFLVLCFGIAAGCQLLEPSQTSPPRTDGPVLVPVDGDGTVVSVGNPDAVERPSTVADDAIDTVAAVGGTVTGNPLLWGLAAQLGHLVVGLIAGRKKQPAAT